MFPIIERKTVANVARISVILEGHLEMRKSIFRVFQFLGTQIHACEKHYTTLLLHVTSPMPYSLTPKY